MFLNKLAKSSATAAAAANAASTKNLLSIVVCSSPSSLVLQKRNFSIEEIGKKYGKPFDYENKRYGLLGQIFDSTLEKLGENSLIVTVEGNFGSGKSEFAKQLAQRIQFVHARQPDLEHHLYTLPNGHNLKEIVNGYVGDNKRFRLDSLNEWHLEPSYKSTIAIQHAFYMIRWWQTRNALLHLMSTGQGVVLERSAFSDSVIANSLFDNKLLSDEAWRFYIRDLVPNTLVELWRPHVVIYLDKPVEECLKTIKSKGQQFEKDSQVYTASLLNSVENHYKKDFLPEIRGHLHVLTYNANEVSVDRVIEDMELLDFEDSSKFSDWRIRKELTLNGYRRVLANLRNSKLVLKAPDSYVKVPEYLLYGNDYAQLCRLMEEDPRFTNQEKNVGLFSKFSTHKEKIWF